MSNSKLFLSIFLSFSIIFFISSSSFCYAHKCSDEQSDALLLFKQNFSSTDHSHYICEDTHGSRYYPIMKNWNATSDCCNWHGVTCNNLTGDVIGLQLTCGRLQGHASELDTLLSSLPNLALLNLSYSGLSVFPESLRAMKNLQSLDLSNNGMLGHIPDWAGEIRGLKYLSMQSNLIEGPFPTSICNMSNLMYLDLSHNSFGGVLPQCLRNISSTLMYLNVNSNVIQGPFPPICNMSNLKHLDMSNNSFDGVISQCLGNITSTLAMIDLGLNYFHGTIPNVYEDCAELEVLILRNNQLEGKVPSFLSKCQSLKVLDLSYNHLNDTFPRWLGDLPKLQVLILRSNNLHGPIETSSTMQLPFRRVQIFDLSGNEFVGHLPGKYFETFDAIKDVEKDPKMEHVNISSNGITYSIIVDVKDFHLPLLNFFVDYTIVDLSDNKFEGEIPNIFGTLSSLIVLNLSHNNLSSQITPALGNLFQIELLDLSSNQLIGEIPQSLVNLTYLEVLNLSQNHLAGCIPEGKQFNTFSGDSYWGNPELCGFPLPKKCEHPSSPQLVEVDGDGEGNEVAWKPMMLGFVFGTILGLVFGYCMLSTGRPKWFCSIAQIGEHMIKTRQNKRKLVYIRK